MIFQFKYSRGDGMPIFSQVFEPQVLAVLTRHIAVFPQNKLIPDSHNEFPRTPSSATPQPKDLGPGGFPFRSRRMGRRVSIKPRELPLSYNQEMINSLPPLCFPGRRHQTILFYTHIMKIKNVLLHNTWQIKTYFQDFFILRFLFNFIFKIFSFSLSSFIFVLSLLSLPFILHTHLS